MRSKAHFKTHPIHPMLIPFPIAFLAAAPAFDAAGLAADRASLWTTGAYMAIAGLVAGPVAGVFGFIDYLYAVPPKSSGKSRAFSHMLVNLSALGLVAVGLFFRDWDSLRPGVVAVVLEAAALGLLVWGGWLGGTLVYRNQIGVDHRYAEAGKWMEAEVDARPGQPVAVARADELEVDQMKLLRLPDGRRLVLARTEQGYVAFDDHCTHKGGSLAGGIMICGTVSCPWHGSQFDVRDGRVKAGPAERPINTYKVEQSGDEVRLIL